MPSSPNPNQFWAVRRGGTGGHLIVRRKADVGGTTVTCKPLFRARCVIGKPRKGGVSLYVIFKRRGWL